MQMEKEGKRSIESKRYRERLIEYQELQLRQRERNIEKEKELVKKAEKAISAAMDKLIHNQGWLTSSNKSNGRISALLFSSK